MTHEEAIKHLLLDWHINLGCDFAIKPGRLDDFLAALDVALSALRPITREQAEKMRGKFFQAGIDDVAQDTWRCSRCLAQEFGNVQGINFCPSCGAPMTDEAVDMVMERLEALHGKVD